MGNASLVCHLIGNLTQHRHFVYGINFALDLPESDEPDLAVFVVQLVHDGDFRRVSGLGSLCLIIRVRSDAIFFLLAFC